MRIDTATPRIVPLRFTWKSAIIALVVLTGAFFMAGMAVRSPADAATVTINQCNGVNGSPSGATTGITCSVSVINTISGGVTSSVTTVTRLCSLGPCAPGNGTFVTRSTSLVTNVSQCNGSGNDAAPPLITCTVSITNNISADTPGASAVTAATVNECVGTGTGGGTYGAFPSRVCNPYPASTTNATVTQCNGSVTGGGSTANCTVGTASVVSPVIPITVNQCNGTGNKGGTLLTCRTTISTNITTAVGGTPTPGGGSTTPGGGSTGSTGGSTTGGSTGAAGTGASSVTPAGNVTGAGAPAQLGEVPSGGVGAGGGLPSRDGGLLTLGGCLLLAGVLSPLLFRRVARRADVR